MEAEVMEEAVVGGGERVNGGWLEGKTAVAKEVEAKVVVAQVEARWRGGRGYGRARGAEMLGGVSQKRSSSSRI